MSFFNQLNDFVSKLLRKNIARGAKIKTNGQSYFRSIQKYKKNLISAHIDCCNDFHLNMWQFGEPNTMFHMQQEFT